MAPTRSEPQRLLAGALVGIGLLGLLYEGLQWAPKSRTVRAAASLKPAAPFALERMAGGQVTLASLRGKVVMLDFWATWCGPCVEEMPVLVKLAKAYEAKGVAFVAASRDDPATWKVDVGLFADRSVPALPPYVAFSDDATTDRYGVEYLPTLYFIGRTGAVLESYAGFADEATLRSRIDLALEESP